MEQTFKCLSCGANIDFLPGMISYVCEYCNSVMIFKKNELHLLNQKAEIVPFPTTLKCKEYLYVIDANDSNDILFNRKVQYLLEREFNEKKISNYLAKFYIYGHIRYEALDSFQDKFFLRLIDSKLGIDKEKNLVATENEGQIKLYYLEILQDDGFFDTIYNSNNPNEKGFFIQEKGFLKVSGLEGGIPYDVDGISQINYLKLIGSGLKAYLIEKHKNDKILFQESI